MTQVASPDSVVGNFDGVELEQFGRQYRLGRDGEHFWVEFDVPASERNGTPSQVIRRNVVLCTGSHHQQVYWVSTDKPRDWAVLPFAWLIADQTWIHRESTFLQPAPEYDVDELGRWNGTCIICHTTHGNGTGSGSASSESSVAEFGIACEACHGPGDLHVQYQNKTPGAPPHDPITNPIRLSHERASEVCGRCHMAWHNEAPGSTLAFQPGDDLRAQRKTTKDLTQFWPDGMIRVAGREFNGLIDSACFQQGEMSCFSCHTLHQADDDERPRADWTDDQLKPGMRGDKACLACHDEYRSLDQVAAHTHHDPDSQGSRCYNCHMPHTTYGVLKANRSHQISSPTIAETVEAGRPNACNLCHLDQTLKWTDEKLVSWYGHAPTELGKEQSEIALSAYMTLAGNAGQRALMAWHLGWSAAHEASGDRWAAPYLATLLRDDYPAVRITAHRSLRQIDGFADIDYHPEMSTTEILIAIDEIMNRWNEQPVIFDKPALLISPAGKLDLQKAARIQAKRDTTVTWLVE